MIKLKALDLAPAHPPKRSQLPAPKWERDERRKRGGPKLQVTQTLTAPEHKKNGRVVDSASFWTPRRAFAVFVDIIELAKSNATGWAVEPAAQYRTTACRVAALKIKGIGKAETARGVCLRRKTQGFCALDEKPIFISMKDTCRQLAVSRSAIELRIAAGTFPAKVYFGDGKRFAFVRAEIDEWAAGRIAERDARAA